MRETRVHAAQLLKRANHQARADEQHERERHLHHDQQVARPVAFPAALNVRPTPRSAVATPGPAYFTTGMTPKSTPDSKDTPRRTPARTDRCRFRAGAAGSPDLSRPGSATPHRPGQDPRAAQHAERHAFDEHFPRDSSPAGAERGPDRELLLPGLGAHERQVGHVRAGDQQHQPQAAHDHPQRRADVSDDFLLQGQNPGRQASLLKYRANPFLAAEATHSARFPASGRHRLVPAPW